MDDSYEDTSLGECILELIKKYANHGRLLDY